MTTTYNGTKELVLELSNNLEATLEVSYDGYYEDAIMTGHPDNWSPAESDMESEIEGKISLTNYESEITVEVDYDKLSTKFQNEISVAIEELLNNVEAD